MDSSNALVVENVAPAPVLVGGEPGEAARVATGAPIEVVEARPAAVLRGTARGLEAHIDAGAPTDAIVAAIEQRLGEAPAFFRGSDIRIRVEDGPLAAGCLTRLDDLAGRFELQIVEITAAKRPKDDGVPQPNLAAGSAPAPVSSPTVLDDAAPAAPAAVEVAPAPSPSPAVEAPVAAPVSAPVSAAVSAPIDLTPELEIEAFVPGPRLVVGPVRSGVILEHPGHVIVFGDVNPGAEVRAEGNIIVLGRLRGTAHAGIGQDAGFILALQLQPQQLRIGRQVARAADSDKPSTDAEIAFGTGDGIVVERYLGRLPRNLASSI